MVWEVSDRICGKRLHAALPYLVDSVVRERLLTASASTLDRLLKPIRSSAGSRRRRGRRKPMGHRVPVRTYNDWNRPPPGYLEIDLVAHCGGPLSGSFIHSLVAQLLEPTSAPAGPRPFPCWPGTRAWSLRAWKPSSANCPLPSVALTPTTTAPSFRQCKVIPPRPGPHFRNEFSTGIPLPFTLLFLPMVYTPIPLYTHFYNSPGYWLIQDLEIPKYWKSKKVRVQIRI